MEREDPIFKLKFKDLNILSPSLFRSKGTEETVHYLVAPLSLRGALSLRGKEFLAHHSSSNMPSPV